MTHVRGDAGELVQLLVDVLTGLPEPDALNTSTYIAIAIGGEPMTKSPRYSGVIPENGTVGAEMFIEGSTLEMGPYLQLLATRLNKLAAGGVREDFLVRSVIAEVTRQLTHLADVESGNTARAEMLAKMEESGAEIPESFRERMRPLGQAEADALTDDLNRWVDACEAALPDAVFDDWMLRSIKRS